VATLLAKRVSDGRKRTRSCGTASTAWSARNHSLDAPTILRVFAGSKGEQRRYASVREERADEGDDDGDASMGLVADKIAGRSSRGPMTPSCDHFQSQSCLNYGVHQSFSCEAAPLFELKAADNLLFIFVVRVNSHNFNRLAELDDSSEPVNFKEKCSFFD
jgi:hypothetical protein